MNDFVDIIENKLGIKSAEDFEAYYAKKIEEGATQEEIDQLSPDNIDNQAFWRYIDEKYNKAICGARLPEYTEESIRVVNSVLASQCGSICFLQGMDYWNKVRGNDEQWHLLEIGTGLGSGKVWFDIMKRIHYTGIDVVARIPGVIEYDGHTIPVDQLPAPFGVVYSCNVFQHLSRKQRRSYYDQIYNITAENAIFILSTQTVETSSNSGRRFVKGADGYNYICHYGQFTPVDERGEILRAVHHAGFTTKQMVLNDTGFNTFVFSKTRPAASV